MLECLLSQFHANLLREEYQTDNRGLTQIGDSIIRLSFVCQFKKFEISKKNRELSDYTDYQIVTLIRSAYCRQEGVGNKKNLLNRFLRTVRGSLSGELSSGLVERRKLPLIHGINVFISSGAIAAGAKRWLVFQAPLRFEEVDCIWPPDPFWKERRS